MKLRAKSAVLSSKIKADLASDYNRRTTGIYEHSGGNGTRDVPADPFRAGVGYPLPSPVTVPPWYRLANRPQANFHPPHRHLARASEMTVLLLVQIL